MSVPGPGLLALGWCYELWPDGASVAVGRRPIDPWDALTHRVWAATRGAPDHPAGQPWTPADVARVAGTTGPDTTAVLGDLAAQGAVVGIDPAEPRPVARTLTLLPLAEGWGNSAAEPTVYRYGLGDVELARLPRVLHDALSLVHRWPDLAAACDGLAAMARDAGVPMDEARDGDALLRLVVGWLPVWCSIGLVCVQPAGEV